MLGAPSVVPEVDSGLCLPRVHPATSCRKLDAPQIYEPRHPITLKARLEVPFFYPDGRTRCQVNSAERWRGAIISAARTAFAPLGKSPG